MHSVQFSSNKKRLSFESLFLEGSNLLLSVGCEAHIIAGPGPDQRLRKASGSLDLTGFR
jgi:hypothetical protein